MDKELRKLIRKAERKYNEAEMALQESIKLLVKGYENWLDRC